MIRFRVMAQRIAMLALPAMLSQLGQFLMGFTDTLMLAGLRPNERYLAGMSLAGSMFFIILVFGIGVVMMLTPRVSSAIAAGKKEDAATWFAQSLHVNLICSLFMILAVLLSVLLLPTLRQNAAVTGIASDYLLIMCLNIPLVMAFLRYKQFLDGMENLMPGTVATFIALGSNIFFNYLLIYGNWGLPEMRVTGAALATTLSRLIGWLYLVIYLHRTPKYSFVGTGIQLPAWGKIRELMSDGIPAGMQYVFEVGIFSLSALMAGWYSTAQQAAHQVVIQLAAGSYLITSGISAAASIIIGGYTGNGDTRRARLAATTSLGMAALIMALFALMFSTLNDYLPRMFTDEAPVLRYAIPLLYLAAAFQLSDGIQATALGVLRGAGDVRRPAVFTFISYWCIGAPMAFVLGEWAGWEIFGIWAGLCAGLTCSAILLTLRIYTLFKACAG